MQVHIHKITVPEVLPFVQYIIFNRSVDKANSTVVTSFANENICLGIIKDHQIHRDENSNLWFESNPGIHSYISGMYMKPHRFMAKGLMDEICIDFTPIGYYHFFKSPVKTYAIGEDVLKELWGSDSKLFFEQIFALADLAKRGKLIETYLASKLKTFDNYFLKECIYHLHTQNIGESSKKLAKLLKCSEKKLSRHFINHFDISPKDYLRITRFRRALKLIAGKSNLSLTDICHKTGYYDQSHFNKEIAIFTGKTPRSFKNLINEVENSIYLAFEK